jgi:hypothetical protein
MSETKFHTHTEPQPKLSSCIFKFLVFWQQTRRQKALNRMIASITRIQSPLNFLLNQILVCYYRPQYFNCDTFSNNMFAIFMSQFWPTFWWLDSNIYLVLSTFISRPTPLLASIKICVYGHYASPWFYLKYSILDTGSCIHLQVEHTQLGPIDRASPYLRTPAPTQDKTEHSLNCLRH